MGRAIFLGVIQGLTEFLPVSSSGHLVLAEKLMGSSTPDLYMQVFLHSGTLLALIVVYHRKLGSLLLSAGRATVKRMVEGDLENLLFLAYLAVGTVPAMAIGYAFQKPLERAFDSAYGAGLMMMLTGTVLFLTRFARERRERVGIADSVLIGSVQAISLLPGISRSGLTISAGLFRGLSKSDAADFSFMLAIPSILIVTVYDLLTVRSARPESIGHYAVGMVSALIVGYAAVRWLLGIVRRGKFSRFCYYCWAAGFLGILAWTAKLKGGF